jgi:1-acyl-sn-glycerol-3-phosphate acyltransferase
MGGPLKVLRPFFMLAVLISAVVLAALMMPLRLIGIGLDYYVMLAWADITLWIYQIKIVRMGERSKEPAIIVTNHISYWDILTIASAYKAFFVSKASVKNWPLIGWGARMVRTVFIVREKTSSAVEVLNREALKLINQNQSVVMFAEGTTSINPCLPFKNGAFHMSMNTGKPIKPIAVYYSRMDLIRWIDDESFVPHLFNMSTAPKSNCYIYQFPLMYPKDYKSVDEMKTKCQAMIQSKINFIRKDILGEKL